MRAKLLVTFQRGTHDHVQSDEHSPILHGSLGGPLREADLPHRLRERQPSHRLADLPLSADDQASLH